jgi:predicted metal-dependent phosphoesterase TrpH
METAAANGVQVLSLTDHDSTEGLAEAAIAAEGLGLRLIPGLELSTDLGKADVHLLAFGFDAESAELQEFLRWLREGRLDRTRKTVDILRANGMPIELRRVFEIAGEATVGRPHVARALVEAGHVASVQEAFDLWLGNGKPADVDREKLSPKDAIEQVHRAGGVVFAAHPIFIGDNYPDVIEQFAEWGLDGIETYYKHYDAETIEFHRALGERLGLMRSGGSDYHGLGNPDDREIGDIPFPDERVDEFVQYLERRGVNTGLRRSV